MTAANVPIPGTRRIVSATPSDASEATLLTAASEKPTVVQVLVTNLTNAAANATVKWRDSSASTDYSLIDTYPVQPRGYLLENLIVPLESGDLIKITSGTGSALTFHIVIVEFVGTLGGEHAH